MKITGNINLEDFEAWAGAEETQELILKYSKGEEFEGLVEELFPDGLDDTALNDLLRFDSDWILKSLGLSNY